MIRCTHRLTLVFFSLGLALLPICARAQTAPPSSLLSEIHATGSSNYTEAQIATASGLHTGEKVTRDQIQAAADGLSQLGVFSHVNYNFTSHGDSITLNLVLEDAPQVPVEFDNFPWFSDDELNKAIREAAPLFTGTAPVEGTQLDQMAEAVGKVLQARGVSGTVEHKLIAQPWADILADGPIAASIGIASDAAVAAQTDKPIEKMMMQFRLEGADVLLDSLNLGDALAAGSEPLRDRQRDLLQKPFSRVAIKLFEQEQIRPIYLSTGRLRVRFAEPVVRVTGQPGGKVSVALRIEPGPVFHLADVNWTGAKVVPEATLRQLLMLKSGDLADGLKFASGLLRIGAEYSHLGYLEVKLDPRPQFNDAAATVSYRVAVSEGPQYHMGELILTGLSLDAARSLRTVWRIPAGAVFDGDYFQIMLNKLAKPSTEIFGSLPVHYMELGHWLRTNSQAHTADVLLDFK